MRNLSKASAVANTQFIEITGCECSENVKTCFTNLRLTIVRFCFVGEAEIFYWLFVDTQSKTLCNLCTVKVNEQKR